MAGVSGLPALPAARTSVQSPPVTLSPHFPAPARPRPPPPAALSEAVEVGKPHGVSMLGRQFVLFREEDGAVRCLDNICPHRWGS